MAWPNTRMQGPRHHRPSKRDVYTKPVAASWRHVGLAARSYAATLCGRLRRTRQGIYSVGVPTVGWGQMTVTVSLPAKGGVGLCLGRPRCCAVCH